MAKMNYSNTVSGTTSGAIGGASAGAKIAGGWGTLVGGAIGGLGGLISGLYSDYQNKKARKQAEQSIDNWNAEATKLLDDAHASQVKLSGENDLKNYQGLKSGYNPDDYVYDFDEYDDSKWNVEDFLNPNKEAILNDIGKSVQHTAAGSALGHSSGTLSSIVAQQMAKDEQLYKDAREAMNQERRFDYGRYQDYITNMQNKLNNKQQGIINQMNMLGEDIKFDQQQEDNYTTNKLNLGNSINNARVSLMAT